MDLLEHPDAQPFRALFGAGTTLHPLHGPCFVCEGRLLVQEALAAHRAGHLIVRSVLGTPGALATLDLPEGIPALAASAEAISGLANFTFNRGLLCAVSVPPPPDPGALTKAQRLLVLPRVDQVDNLGLLLRSAAALGMEGVLLGRGPGAFDRRTVRVSMGAAWRLPVWRSETPETLLEAWRSAGGEVVGAALAPGALDARRWIPAPRTALVLGPEGEGLEQAWLERCDLLAQIPMARGMDSLNVAAAGAILMWRLSMI
ncbi:MAG: putative TrmH family tRNA/rRNA methyltransferase [Acidobacteria bacterium ADurb.Bin340]|nr:MAG: putative TrmH family tRNA/rRNA methyltransferase [Acidobacteria bacterium ADurb.Bin340]HOD33378.1 RNA methyltransferase [Holophaga sp.]HQL47658.1 RNA methyltransferase [Holophaga sp.]